MTRPKLNPSSYQALAQWHHTQGSNEYYINYLQERAAQEGVPLDVIYFDNQNSKWRTVRDLATVHPFRCSWEKKD